MTWAMLWRRRDHAVGLGSKSPWRPGFGAWPLIPLSLQLERMPNVGSQQSVPLTPSGHNLIFAFGVMQLIHIQLSCQIVTPGFMAPGMGSLFSCGLTRPWRTDLDRVRSWGKSASAHLRLQLGVSSCEPISASMPNSAAVSQACCHCASICNSDIARFHVPFLEETSGRSSILISTNGVRWWNLVECLVGFCFAGSLSRDLVSFSTVYFSRLPWKEYLLETLAGSSAGSLSREILWVSLRFSS